MNCLPLELSAMVFGHLIEYDLAPKASSEYTEEPADRLTRWEYAELLLNWVILTQGSRSWIINTRLSSWKMYHTSHAAFAKLLGDRKFRYTRVGMDDMAGIGQKTDLAPHITTLTIGCGGFHWPGDVNTIKKHLSALKHAEHERLYKAYKTCAHWQQSRISKCQDTLTSLFRAFPNLNTVRIDVNDHPIHLGGWLQGGDEELLQHWNVTDIEMIEVNRKLINYRFSFNFFYQTNAVATSCVVEALAKTDIALKDLRISQFHNSSTFQNESPWQNLHTLRVVVPDAPNLYSATSPGVDNTPTAQFIRVLSNLSNLQDLALALPMTEHYDLGEILGEIANHKQLGCVEFGRGWLVLDEDFVNFVEGHAHSLRCLIFDKIILVGSWPATLRAIADATKGHLEYFRARLVYGWDSDACNPAFTSADLADFTCAVDWIHW